MPNPTPPSSGADVISSALFGRPVSAHVVRGYLSSANRDADNAPPENGQVAAVGYQLTTRDAASWRRAPARADVAYAFAAGDGLIPVNYWVPVGTGVWCPIPPDADVIVTADVCGLEVPFVEGTPILLLGVNVSDYGWVELARTSAAFLWNTGSMHGTAHVVGGIAGGAHYFQTGLYVTNPCALRAALASFSLTVMAV